MSSYIYKGWKAQGWRSGGGRRNFFAVYIGTHACVPVVGVAVVFRVAWRDCVASVCGDDEAFA